MSESAVIPSVYLADALMQLLAVADVMAPPWELLLWTADIEPDGSTVLADLGEVSWGGYTRRTVQRSDWGTPVVTGACAASTPANTPYSWVFGSGSAETVRGWALWEDVSSRLVLIVRLPEADELEVGPGQTYQLTPSFTLTGGLC